MRIQTLLGYALVFAAFFGATVADSDTAEPDVVAVASFGADNAFGHVVNGESNKIFITIENKSDRNITLENIAGSFHHPETGKLVKNTTAMKYKLPLLEGTKLQLPYQFYSEYKPGDLRLNIWLEHSTDGQNYRVSAYDSIISIVEPKRSFLDIQMWITYLIVLGIFGGAGYYAYLTLVPQPKKRKAPNVTTNNAPTSATTTASSPYEEEWIPEHHLNKPKARKTKAAGAASGDETSGTELSGAEAKKRKPARK